MCWLKSIQNDANQRMPWYILAHLGFNDWNVFDLDIITFKEGGLLIPCILLKYLSVERGKEGRRERRGDTTNSLDSIQDLLQEKPPFSGVTTGFRNLTTVINLFVWRNPDLSQFECLKSLQCQNTFALIISLCKAIVGIFKWHADSRIIMLRKYF